MIVLQYDPYSQTAEFKRENEETGVISDFKDLKKEQKDRLKMLEKDIILQNQIENLIKILKDIDRQQQFRFIGTQKDFEDFEAGLKNLAPNGSAKKSNTPFFYEPSYIREQLQKICDTVRQNIETLNKKYPEHRESLRFDSSELDAMLADRTPLVFMGSGSAGKSSVINAIVGEEILPTGDGTTTEFVCEIIPDKCYAISYQQNGSVFKIDLNGMRADAEANLNAVLHAEVQLDTENPYDWVYTAVNELSKQANIEELRVHIPFKNLSGISEQIVIYDTPGPDSKTRKSHKEILNAALGRFKKGVAVFVIGPTDIEKTNLRSFLKEYTDNSEQLLDILNVNAGIVIVNGADKTSLTKIEEGKESRKKHLEQAADDSSKSDFLREQDRMIYFSSPFALAVHKGDEDSWKDSGFEECYSFGLKKMCDVSNKFYLPLAKAAELPILRENAIRQKYEEAEKRYLEDNSDENRKELIAHNSGLRALEYEISFVVNELSICNLCAQAQKQLEDVLCSVRESSKKISEEIAYKETEMREVFEAKYQDILNRLFNDPDSALKMAIDAVNSGVTAAISGNVDVTSAATREIQDTIRSEWHKVKKDKDPKDQIKAIIENSHAIAEEQAACNDKARKYCREAFEEFKKACQEIVSGSSGLSQEEQDALEECVRNWETVNLGKISITKKDVEARFLVFRWTSKDMCMRTVETLVPTLIGNMYQGVYNAVKESFRDSCEEAKQSFYTEDKIKMLNPELKKLSEQIESLTAQKEDYEDFHHGTERDLKTVKNLTELQEKGAE